MSNLSFFYSFPLDVMLRQAFSTSSLWTHCHTFFLVLLCIHFLCLNILSFWNAFWNNKWGREPSHPPNNWPVVPNPFTEWSSFPIDLKYSLYNLPNSHLHLVLIIDYFVSWTICILLQHSFNYHVIVHFNVEWKGWGAYPPYPQILLFLFQNFPGYSNMFILIEL